MWNDYKKTLSHYAWKWHPLFCRILTRRWSTKVERFKISECIIDAETFLIAFQRSFKFLNCLPLQYTLLLITAHSPNLEKSIIIIIIYLKSIRRPYHHQLVLKANFLRNSEVYFELCAGALSCWKIIVLQRGSGCFSSQGMRYGIC